MLRHIFCMLVVALVQSLALLPEAYAQDAPSPEADKVEEAKELFRQGVEVHSAGDSERALQFFIKSRQAFPSVQNTSNVAVVLDELGRYDEALELYELLLVEFKDELNDEDLQAIGPSIATLRGKVGSVFVSANVNGKVVIDGRARAELPLDIAIRVLPGDRQIRVMRNGYVTWERRVMVKRGATVNVDAKLEPLADAGLLRIDDANAKGARVFIDGAAMGTVPWEGTVGPGTHVVWTIKGDVGSGPKQVIVVQGQAALIILESKPLGGELVITTQPTTARIQFGGLDLGAGRWAGRLPLGDYRLQASEEGYYTATEQARVTQSHQTVRLKLVIDPAHPRWPTAETGEVFVHVVGGLAAGPGFNAQAEAGCTTCPDSTTVIGATVGARGGYRFPAGIALELGLGYLRLGSSFNRVSALDDQVGVLYPIDDALLLHGPFTSVGASYRYMATDIVGLSARAGAGAFFEFAEDTISVRATKNGETATLVVQDVEPVARGISVFVQGELGVELVFGQLQLGVAMGIIAFATEGATHEQRTTALPLDCDTSMPDSVGCIRTGTPVPDERSHDTFFVAHPQLSVGYGF